MDEKAHDKDHSLELEISKPNSNKVIHSENKKKTHTSSKIYTLLVVLACLSSLPVICFKYFQTKNSSLSDGTVINDMPPKYIKGSMIECSGIDCGWQKSPQYENLSAPSVVIPVLKIRKTNYNSEGFIRVVFQSPSGKIQGDPQTMKFNDSFVIRSTKGLDNMLKFVDYKSENNSNNYEKWTITLSESKDGTQWKKLSSFKIPGKIVTFES